MSLPFLRISERTREVEEKRRALENSLQDLRSTVQEKTAPVAFLVQHPKILLTAVISGLSALKLTKNVLGGKSSKEEKKQSTRGWLMKTAAFLGMTGLKFATPLAVGAVKKVLSRHSRESGNPGRKK